MCPGMVRVCTGQIFFTKESQINVKVIQKLKSMCSSHSDAKHTKTLEFRTEKGML